MALPSGPNEISFLDFQTENGFVYAPGTTPPTDMYTYALVYGVSFTIDGYNPISMDEFFNKSAPTYDVYEGFGTYGPEYSYVPYSMYNPFQAFFNGTCASKITYPSIKYGVVLTTYPSAVFYNAPGESCGEAP